MNTINSHVNLHKMRSSNGGALVIILLAVSLFGALSYTVANMLRSDGGVTALSDQQTGIIANEILEYARTMRQTVRDLQISNGCSDEEISFENTVVAGYVNPNAPADLSCHVFEKNGGGLEWKTRQQSWLDTKSQANAVHGFNNDTLFISSCIPEIGSGDDVTCAPSPETSRDLVMFIPFLQESICKQINKALGVTISPYPDSGVYTVSLSSARFTGSFSGSGTMGTTATYVAGCFYDPSAASSPGIGFHFYQIIIGR